MKLKAIIALASLLTWGALTARAQNNMTTFHGMHHDVFAARYSPSALELPPERSVQIGMGLYSWAGNTQFSSATLQDIFSGDDFTQEIEDYLSELDGDNLVGLGVNVNWFNLAVQAPLGKNDRRFAFSFTGTDRIAGTIVYPKKLLDLAWRGNKQFAGQGPVDLGSLEVEVAHMREYAFGLAVPVFGNDGRGEGIGIRAGLRAKYIQGLGGLKLNRFDATINTPESGEFIDIAYDYQFVVAGREDGEDLQTDGDYFLNANAQTFGFDLDAMIFLDSNWVFNVGVLDFGPGLTYEDGTTTYSKSVSERYEGATVSNIFGDPLLNNPVDSATYLYEVVEEDGGSFTVDLPTRLVLRGEYTVHKMTRNGREYEGNTVIFTYVQGFGTTPGTSGRPFLNLGYNHGFGRAVQLGASGSYGGYNQFALGTYAAFNVGDVFKIGLGSDNVLPFILPDAGTGLDFACNFMFSF